MAEITIENLLREREELKDRIRALELSIGYAMRLLDGDHIDQAAAVLQLELEKGGVAHD